MAVRAPRVELQIGGSDQWGNITAGIDLVRRTPAAGVTGSPGRCSPAPTARSSARPPAARSGSTRPRPPRTSSASSGCRPPTTRSAGYLLPFSACGRRAEIDELMAEHERRPSAAWRPARAGRELTALVHGREAAGAAERGGRRPLRRRSPRRLGGGLRRGRPEVRSDRGPGASSATPVGLLVAAGLGRSNSDARRTSRSGVRANGQVHRRPRGRLAGELPLHRRPVPAAAQGQDQLPRGGMSPEPRLTVGGAAGRVISRPEGRPDRLGHSAAGASTAGALAVCRCERASLLENGREDEERQCGRLPSVGSRRGSRRYAHQFQPGANPPGGTSARSGAAVVPISTITGAGPQGFVPESIASSKADSSMESLILAQDERWRRA